MEKFTMAGGVAVRYFDIGKGERIIFLLHGYLESIEIWDDFAGQLGKEFRVIGMDIPGHGVSEVVGEVHTMAFVAEVMADLLRKIGVQRCVVVGHSMGGYVAQAFAKAHPEMLAGLVLFHSSPNLDSQERKENRQREIELIRSGKKELLAQVNPGKGFAVENRARFKWEIEELSEQVMFTEDEGIVALLRGMMVREDMNEMLRGLGVPELFVFGKQDEYIPVAAAEEIAAAHPQAEVVWLEHSGHMGFVEQADLVEIVLSGFVVRCYA